MVNCEQNEEVHLEKKHSKQQKKKPLIMMADLQIIYDTFKPEKTKHIKNRVAHLRL